MRALGFDVKKADVLKVMQDYDRAGTGKITFPDFSEVCKLILNMLMLLYHCYNSQQLSDTCPSSSMPSSVY